MTEASFIHSCPVSLKIDKVSFQIRICLFSQKESEYLAYFFALFFYDFKQMLYISAYVHKSLSNTCVNLQHEIVCRIVPNSKSKKKTTYLANNSKQTCVLVNCDQSLFMLYICLYLLKVFNQALSRHFQHFIFLYLLYIT